MNGIMQRFMSCLSRVMSQSLIHVVAGLAVHLFFVFTSVATHFMEVLFFVCLYMRSHKHVLFQVLVIMDNVMESIL